MTNPYAPPQNAETVPAQYPHQSNPITGLSLALVTVWGILTGTFCLVGHYFSMSNEFRDFFGFGGIGLCLVGLPIIAAFSIRPAQNYSSLRACCVLDLLGMLVFIAAVSMQAPRGVRPFHWFLFAAMACATVVISMLFAFLGFFDEKIDALAMRNRRPSEIDTLSAGESPQERSTAP